MKRTSGAMGSIDDYPIGPGDVLTVTVPAMEEIGSRKVRVSAEGQIELPLIGTVQAGGRTEDGLAQELDSRLKQYMFAPQASVFVDEYRNREVAVVGEVNKPGVFVLNSSSETVLDILTEAGGVAATAADELVLIPAGEKSVIAQPAAALKQAAATQSADTMASSAQALSIRLHSTSLTGGGNYLNLPVRPGDVIVVPGGGQVMVVGWVQSPGHFAVGSGLTVLGAIGEAGGPMFAADTKSVTLLRSARDGSKSTQVVNLDQIAHGGEADLPVKANDVIDVPYSDWRIGPFVFYSVLSRIGIAGPAIP
jgi:polysaccharide export outer membrane protein